MDTTLSQEQIEAINAVIVKELSIAAAQVTPDARFFEDLGADSLSIIQMGMALEERFNITLSDEVLERNVTVGDLYEAVSFLLSPH